MIETKQYLLGCQREFVSKSKRHAYYSNLLTVIHYAIGWPQVVLVVLITSINGMIRMDSLFVLGLFNSILAMSAVFFKVLEKAGKHRTTKGQWKDLAIDIQTALLGSDEQKIKAFEITMLEKEKFIRNYEPSFCFDICSIQNTEPSPSL